ncbi:MAG: DNA polymerase III subunit delta' [Gemmatimonadaceae bacterium]
MGKQRLALWLGQLLLCDSTSDRPCGRCQHCRYALAFVHPDLRWRFPRPRLKDSEASSAEVDADYGEAIAERIESHGLYVAPTGSDGIFIATVRSIIQAAALSPALASRKVFVVGDAERMVAQEGADQAANAFLKLLEEPPADTVIVLTTSEPGSLLATIRSRVIAVRVPLLLDGDVRAFLREAAVAAALVKRGLPPTEDARVRLAAGSPGTLLSREAAADALTHAKRMLAAATSPDPGDAARTAFSQGATQARGAFSDALDMLTVLLHQRVRDAIGNAQADRALGAATAVGLVEAAKERAAGNVNPQLITAALLRDLGVSLQ